MDAKLATEISNQHLEKIEEETMGLIYDKIRKAASNGKKEIWFNGLTHFHKDVLKRLGYKIPFWSKFGDSYLIKWK